ncbi:MAG: glycosyltransferase [Candidatus Delongbacteria bacterium]|nr:glycosyltransferase [Candidatus Delongbacteria bacterium]MBN2836577.1 glycosyltransferase [Candidatus Delongbacteria bacterium]
MNNLPKLQYRKFAGNKERVILIDSGYFLIDEISRASRNEGVLLENVKLFTDSNTDPSIQKESRNEGFFEDLLTAIYSFKPDYILTVNLLGFDEKGVLAKLLSEMNVLVANWFTDTPFGIIKNHYSHDYSNMFSFLWEKNYIPELAAKFKNHKFYYLPYGSGFAKHDINEKFISKLSFVGNSMKEATHKWKQRINVSDKEISFFEKLIFEEPKFDKIPDIIDAFTKENRFDNYESSFFYFKGSGLLREKIMRGLDDVGVKVVIYGDEFWKDYGFKNHEIRRNVNYYSELPYVYSSTKISLNLTSPQMPTALNQRVYDCFACGGFLITDLRDDLNILFEDYPEFNSLEDLIGKISYFDNNPDEIEKYKFNLTNQILLEHNYSNRLKFISYILCNYVQN